MDFLPYAKIFNTELEALEPFTDEEVGRLFRGMLRYMKTGEDPGLKGNERFAWGLERNQLNAQHDAYQDKVDSAAVARSAKGSSDVNMKSSRNQVDVNMKSSRNQFDINMTSGEEKRREEKGREEKKRDSKRREENSNSTLSVPSSFSPDLHNALDEWILYKQEQNFIYSEQGWKALITQLRNEVSQYGDEKVAEVIRYSMQNGYAGIVHDRLKDAPKGKKANAEYDQRPATDEEFADCFLNLDALAKQYELEGKI